jgi:cation:H+ antiporter
MEILDTVVLLGVGLLGLWIGTEMVVRGAIVMARRLRVAELVIGLTLLAFGTDLPELVVAIDGAIHGIHGENVSGVIVGNAIGSSICQISLIIGLTSLFHYLNVGKVQIRYLAIELLGSLLMLYLVSFDNVITWNEGTVLVVVFLIYFFSHLQREQRDYTEDEEPEEVKKRRPLWWYIAMVIIGLVVVIFSSNYTIDHAMELTRMWGVRQSFVGAIIVGAGTSLPELAVSVGAILKRKPGLSVGSIIGSNIFDLLIPLGVGSLISTIEVNDYILWIDLPFLFVISCFVLLFLSRTKGLQRREGAGLILLYMGYALSKFYFNIF